MSFPRVTIYEFLATSWRNQTLQSLQGTATTLKLPFTGNTSPALLERNDREQNYSRTAMYFWVGTSGTNDRRALRRQDKPYGGCSVQTAANSGANGETQPSTREAQLHARQLNSPRDLPLIDVKTKTTKQQNVNRYRNPHMAQVCYCRAANPRLLCEPLKSRKLQPDQGKMDQPTSGTINGSRLLARSFYQLSDLCEWTFRRGDTGEM
jgi:hypothetical protein